MSTVTLVRDDDKEMLFKGAVIAASYLMTHSHISPNRDENGIAALANTMIPWYWISHTPSPDSPSEGDLAELPAARTVCSDIFKGQCLVYRKSLEESSVLFV